MSCCRSDFSPIRTPLCVFSRPLPRRPALSPYFQSCASRSPVCHREEEKTVTQDSIKSVQNDLLLEEKGTSAFASSAKSVISFCDNERLQTDRGPLSSGCYHHPATQNMEKQVVCRCVFYYICYNVAFLMSLIDFAFL